MSLTLIKAQLATNLATITGITRVYSNTPEIAPTEADCPAVIMEKGTPFLTALAEANQLILYTWNFDIKFLMIPTGLGIKEEWDSALEPYFKRFVDKFWGDIKLSGNAQDIVENMDFDSPIVEYLGTTYVGFSIKFGVREKIVTTFA